MRADTADSMLISRYFPARGLAGDHKAIRTGFHHGRFPWRNTPDALYRHRPCRPMPGSSSRACPPAWGNHIHAELSHRSSLRTWASENATGRVTTTRPVVHYFPMASARCCWAYKTPHGSIRHATPTGCTRGATAPLPATPGPARWRAGQRPFRPPQSTQTTSGTLRGGTRWYFMAGMPSIMAPTTSRSSARPSAARVGS